ncbi:MAG: CDP-diacylglycerol--serine O-phosphatidyltransferase [Firmicutes bacterium]|nr:CDP-diacylglycerol--serine O-phosphatidyltransferase [Bacillota bacterium]
MEPAFHMTETRKGADQRLRRGVLLLPSIFTVANLLCGYYAILATFRGGLVDLDNAAKAIGLAILFDSLDGRVARATRTNTEFGKQFDSLADVISFGIAPAFLAFAWGVRGLLGLDDEGARQVYQLGWLVTFGFVLCGAWRLARFNLHGMSDHTSRYFVGLPTPAAAGMVAATVHFFKSPIDQVSVALLWLWLVATLAVLMASTIRYYSFKNIPWSRPFSSLVVVLIGLLLAVGIVHYSEPVLLLMASSYILSGAALELVRSVRHRWVSRPVTR